MISADVILDSLSPDNHRLTTMRVRCPRFIWDEVLTHRAFSRNASSLRAVPTKRLIEDVKAQLAEPVEWSKNKPGMIGGDLMNLTGTSAAQDVWRAAAQFAIMEAGSLAAMGVHKQIANRLLMPFAHVNGLITATEWDNFFTLRRHWAADPTVAALAEALWTAQQASTPNLLRPGQWHLPFVRDQDWNTLTDDYKPFRTMIQISVARCARISYQSNATGKDSTTTEDLILAAKLLNSQPMHASPAEHQATPDQWDEEDHIWRDGDRHGNFKGWVQYRKTLAMD